jgi:hypothetical protein
LSAPFNPEPEKPEISRAAAKPRALDKEDQKLLRLMTKRVGVALRIQRDNGVVRSLDGPGQFVLWEVAK